MNEKFSITLRINKIIFLIEKIKQNESFMNNEQIKCKKAKCAHLYLKHLYWHNILQHF